MGAVVQNHKLFAIQRTRHIHTINEWINEHGLTFTPTQYRLYGRQFFLQVWWPNQQCQSTEGGWLVIQTGLSLTRLTSPCYNNTTCMQILYKKIITIKWHHRILLHIKLITPPRLLHGCTSIVQHLFQITSEKLLNCPTLNYSPDALYKMYDTSWQREKQSTQEPWETDQGRWRMLQRFTDWYKSLKDKGQLIPTSTVIMHKTALTLITIT